MPFRAEYGSTDFAHFDVGALLEGVGGVVDFA